MKAIIEFPNDISLHDVLEQLKEFKEKNKEFIIDIEIELDIKPEKDKYQEIQDSLDEVSRDLKEVDEFIKDFINKNNNKF